MKYYDLTKMSKKSQRLELEALEDEMRDIKNLYKSYMEQGLYVDAIGLQCRLVATEAVYRKKLKARHS